MTLKFSIRGLQQAQRAMLKSLAAFKPTGALGRAVYIATTQAHRLAVGGTHVDTGALRSSHMIERQSLTRYRIYLSPTAQNPRSGARTSVYGVAEHERGGDHAFYEKVYRQGRAILTRSAMYVRGSLP